MLKIIMRHSHSIAAALIITIMFGLAAVTPTKVHAAGYTDYAENKIQDYIFRGQASGIPSTWYIGLDSATCNDAGGGTEVTGGSYARVSVVSSLANWSGTQSAGSTSASSGTGGVISNNGAIAFPAPTANWGTLPSVRMWDASTSGNAWACFTLSIPKTVNNGDAAPTFAIGTFTITAD